MAFPAQTVTTAAVGTGHILLGYGAGARTYIGRVVEITDIATGKTYYDHKGYNTGGDKQTVARFPIELGSGAVRVTLDEVPDLDGVAWLGAQAYVSLAQEFKKPASAARCWEWYAPTATIDIVSFKPNLDSPSTVVLEITPYAATGTPAWYFNADAAAPPANH